MNILWHILADNPTEIILRTFDVSEKKLAEYKAMVDGIMELPFSDQKVLSALLELDRVPRKVDSIMKPVHSY